MAFPKVDGASVTLLIGADVPQLFCSAAFRKGRRGGPVAMKTPLGWSLLGPSLSLSSNQNCIVNFVKHHDKTVEQQIQTIWSTDFAIGIIVLDMPFSCEDHLMYKLLQDSVKLVNGRFQLPVPWRSGVTSLPNNRSVALNRLMCLKKRFTKNPSLKEGYVNTIDEYLSKRHASKVNLSTDKCDNVFVWYLPHQPVIHPYKLFKMRVVFDCAAKCKGACLNDALMQESNLTNSLIGVLTRFRKDRAVLVGDIESMFHQVHVDQKDTSTLRFL